MKKRMYSLILSLCVVFTIFSGTLTTLAAASIYYPDTEIPSYTYVKGVPTYLTKNYTNDTPHAKAYVYNYFGSSNYTMSMDAMDYLQFLVETCGFKKGGSTSETGYSIYEIYTEDFNTFLYVVIDLNEKYVEVFYKIYPTSITVERETIELCVGDTVSLSATVFPKGCTDKRVTWVNQNGNVIDITEDGVVTAKKAGTELAVVSAVADDFVFDICIINVVEFVGTETTVSNDGKMFTVKPINVDNGKTVVLALYDGEIFVEMQKSTYEGVPISFVTDKAYTNAKVMVWDDLITLKPVCEAESVK